jgi:23S rRNA pseudouridine2605 synthase
MKERLQKILAQAGICSRRKAEEYIKAGRVSVDGKKVTELGVKADPDRQAVTFDGLEIAGEKKIYLLLNKPKGYVTTLRDPQKRPIVTSLLKGISDRVFPVGRLDIDTEGALLFTNDGDFSFRVLHPGYEVKKTYQATVKGKLSKEHFSVLEQGIMLEGKRTWPARLDIIREKKDETVIQIIIHEGRKRQVRKMFAAVGHQVISLQRLAYGGLQLGRLPVGSFRILDEKDINKIFAGNNSLYKYKKHI